MATTQVNGLMTYVDESGNRYLLYPVTTVENVDGLEDMVTEQLRDMQILGLRAAMKKTWEK